MKITELRIGNYVIAPDLVYAEDNIRKVVGISGVKSIFLKTIDGEKNNRFPIYLITPVPLTEEILLKCGFGEVGFYDNVYHLDDFRIYLDKSINSGLIKYENGACNLEKEISNLHQLQNLYFALIGKDLEVKL